MTTAQRYDDWKAEEPAPQYPDPADPHDACERDIERLEAEVEAAKHESRLSFAELHALVGALLPGESYFITVDVHHSAGSDLMPSSNTVSWRVSYGFHSPGAGCQQVEGDSAGGVLQKLRAKLAPSPTNALEEIGEVPW